MEFNTEDFIKAKILGGGGGGVTPSGKKQITISDVGTVTEDVTNYAEAEISTSGLVKPTGNKAITITEPGTVSDIDVSGEATASVTTQGLVKPTGTLEITENGTGINVSEYASVDVSVSGGGGDLPTWDDRGLSYNSWSTIAAYTRANELWRVAKIGEVKDNFRLVRINTDTSVDSLGVPPKATTNNARDGYELLPDPLGTADFLCINEQTDVVVGSLNYEWTNANHPLRLILSNIYNNLPTDLKSVVVPRTVYVETGYNTSRKSGEYSIVELNAWIPTCADLAQNIHAGLTSDSNPGTGYLVRGKYMAYASANIMTFFKQRHMKHNDNTTNVWLIGTYHSNTGALSSVYTMKRDTFGTDIWFSGLQSISEPAIATASYNLLYGVRIG